MVRKEKTEWVIYCNFCGVPHKIYSGKTECPQCGKPACVRPVDWQGTGKKIWTAK